MYFHEDSPQELKTKREVISEISEALGTVYLPFGWTPEIFANYGYYATENAALITVTKYTRQQALASQDWVESAGLFSDQEVEKIRKWKWLVRNIPNIAPEAKSLPSIPTLKPKQQYKLKDTLTPEEVEKEKDVGSLQFLQEWERLNFTPNRRAVEYLRELYN